VAELNIEPNPGPPVVFVEWTRSIAFDERGAIRWALRFDALPKGETFTLRRSLTGNFLTGSLDTLIEVTKLGRITRTTRLTEHTLNHEILQIGSKDTCEGVSDGTSSEYLGNLLVLASKNGAPTVQDRILEVDAETGTLAHEWDLAQVFDPTRTTFVDPEEWAPGVGDWLHDNGLAYSAVDESLIVSGRHQGVAKIRRDGSLVWLLAPHEGWNEPQLGKLLTAVNASGTPYDDTVQLGDAAAGASTAPEFDWPFGQHSPALLPNGDLLLFDNGVSRHFGSPYASYSRAVIYRIDESAMTVRQMGQVILTTRESSYFVSNTYQAPMTGNLLIHPGGSSSKPAVAKELATHVADDGTVSFDTVVFDAALDLSWADPSRWYAYSYRGHRWVF
jgi:arylsulfate sulfotransferase